MHMPCGTRSHAPRRAQCALGAHADRTQPGRSIMLDTQIALRALSARPSGALERVRVLQRPAHSGIASRPGHAVDFGQEFGHG